MNNTPRKVHCYSSTVLDTSTPQLNPSAVRADNHLKRKTRHILCDCSPFTHQRTHLRVVSLSIILREILGMEKGIEAQVKSIHKSDDFRKVAIPEQEEVKGWRKQSGRRCKKKVKEGVEEGTN
ncbi:hypothetical protein BDR03DRAFT_953567, partial [Suillus americanus]